MRRTWRYGFSRSRTPHSRLGSSGTEPGSQGGNDVELLRWDPDHPDQRVLLKVAEAVLRGGVIAFPTDTLYGLGCSLFDVHAVEMVARLKRRDPRHAVISLIPVPEQAWGLA